MIDADLVAAARFEVASREKHYPALIASGRMNEAEAQHDFEAWHCIGEWLDSGRSPAGWFDAGAGAVIKADARIVVEWLLMEEAVARQVASTEAALATAGPDDAKVQRLGARLAALRTIAARVTRERVSVERLNRLVKEHQQRLAAEQVAA